MTYTITGLDPTAFSDLFALSDADLERHDAMRVTATSHPGFPCRISLQDADVGETLILLHHVSHSARTPYRSSYAIYVRQVSQAAQYCDALPPIMQGRPIGLRYADTSYKRTKRNGDLAGTSVRTWSVEGHDQALATLDEALEILHVQRLGALPAAARG